MGLLPFKREARSIIKQLPHADWNHNGSCPFASCSAGNASNVARNWRVTHWAGPIRRNSVVTFLHFLIYDYVVYSVNIRRQFVTLFKICEPHGYFFRRNLMINLFGPEFQLKTVPSVVNCVKICITILTLLMR